MEKLLLLFLMSFFTNFFNVQSGNAYKSSIQSMFLHLKNVKHKKILFDKLFCLDSIPAGCRCKPLPDGLMPSGIIILKMLRNLLDNLPKNNAALQTIMSLFTALSAWKVFVVKKSLYSTRKIHYRARRTKTRCFRYSRWKLKFKNMYITHDYADSFLKINFVLFANISYTKILLFRNKYIDHDFFL